MPKNGDEFTVEEITQGSEQGRRDDEGLWQVIGVGT